MVIQNYQLMQSGSFSLGMSKDAQILHVGLNTDGLPYIWYMDILDRTSMPLRNFEVVNVPIHYAYTTVQDVPFIDRKYECVGTFTLAGTETIHFVLEVFSNEKSEC